MPGRKYSAGSAYRYGFNGKENDNEVKGEGNQQDYGMRIYDTRLVRFLSVDPLAVSYPWYTPYQFAGNSPIKNIDLDGLEEYDAIKRFLSITINMDKAPATYKSVSGKMVPTYYNLHGYPVNNLYFWDNVIQQYPDFLDDAQKNSVRAGYSPRLTKEFKAHLDKIGYNTEGLKIGDALHHHHINQGRTAVPVTSTEHSKIPIQKNPSGVKVSAKFGRFIGAAITTLNLVSEFVSVFSGNPDAMINQFGVQNEVGVIYKNQSSGLYFSYSQININEKEANGYFMIFGSYTKKDGKYIGIDPLGYGHNYENKITGFRSMTVFDMDGKVQTYEESSGKEAKLY